MNRHVAHAAPLCLWGVGLPRLRGGRRRSAGLPECAAARQPGIAGLAGDLAAAGGGSSSLTGHRQSGARQAEALRRLRRAGLRRRSGRLSDAGAAAAGGAADTRRPSSRGGGRPASVAGRDRQSASTPGAGGTEAMAKSVRSR